jgi:hypothetical protein
MIDLIGIDRLGVEVDPGETVHLKIEKPGRAHVGPQTVG